MAEFQQSVESANSTPQSVDVKSTSADSQTEMLNISKEKESVSPEQLRRDEQTVGLKKNLLELVKSKRAELFSKNPDWSKERRMKEIHKLVDSARFFVTEKEFLNGDGSRVMATPIDRVVRGYDVLETDRPISELQKEKIMQHSEAVLKLAYDQHLDNPEYYVSHGFDHTLNVTDNSESIITQNPEIVSAIQEKYHVSAGEAKFLVTTVGWFHDFGYPHVGELGKAVHAVAGADIVNSEQMRQIHSGLITSEGADTPQLLADIRDAILFHSADKVERAFSSKLVTSHGQFLVDDKNIIDVISQFSREPTVASDTRQVLRIEVPNEEIKAQLEAQLRAAMVDTAQKIGEQADWPTIVVTGQEYKGRDIDLKQKKDALLGVEFQNVDALTSPLHAVIRLADNIDMRAERFSQVQSTPAFREIYAALGDPRGDIGQVTIKMEDLVQISKKEARGEKDPNKSKEILADAIAQLKELAKPFAGELLQSHPNNAELLARIDQASSLDGVLAEWNRAVTERVLEKHADELSGQPGVADKIREIAPYQNSVSFRHFGGCEAVMGVKLVGSELLVTVDKVKFLDLNQVKVAEKTVDKNGVKHDTTVGVGEYQVWRAREAYESIRINGSAVMVRIISESGETLE